MRVVLDIEANGLVNPTEIWLVVCKDVDTGEMNVYRNLTKDEREKERFLQYSEMVDCWIGHHVIGYDLPVLTNLIGLKLPCLDCTGVVDTLVISKLVNYSRKGHSIEDYGEEFGLLKGNNKDPNFFKSWSQELEDYCVRDVEISHQVYLHFLPILNDRKWHASINCEQQFSRVCTQLTNNGFYFNHSRANDLLEKVVKDLAELDEEILHAFPPKFKVIREIIPKLTKYGTINRSDFRWVKDGDLSKLDIKPGVPYIRGEWVPFNPASPKQIVGVLNEAGWKPVNRTKTHTKTIQAHNKLRFKKGSDLEELKKKLEDLSKTGWKIDEENLSTLPASAPKPARLLAKRILMESRRRTLVEWLSLVDSTSRIHGKFYGIGAWTHRMAHQEPNMANIPNEYNVHDGSKKLLGGEMRALWRAPP